MLPIHHAPESEPRTESPRRRDQNPKNLPCRFCPKRFRRVEHVQRHERTHTKEKPFPCIWEGCGKLFARRDLLNRHEKLVHLNEGASKESSRRRRSSAACASSQSDDRPSSSTAPPQLLPPLPSAPSWPPPQQSLDTPRQRYEQQHQHQPHHSLPPQQPEPQRQPQDQTLYHLGPPNPGAGPTSIARGTPRSGACNLDLLSDAALGEPMAVYMERPRDDQGPPLFPPLHVYDIGNAFLGDFTATPYLAPPQLHQDHQTAAWSRPPEGSSLPLPLASLDPESCETGDSQYRVSAPDHAAIKNRIDEYSAVLPSDFVFPSRQTLTRFLHGYVIGFHEQLPLLHLPTLAPAELAPELLLAVLALGAQCRFESNRGHALWYAAKAVAMEQIRRRHSSDVHALLPTAAAYGPHSTRPSPSATYRHSFASAQSERPTTQDTHREPYSPNTPQARLETIQAALLLFAVGLWGAKTILRDALSLQGTLAMLIREEGLSVETSQTMLSDWDSWRGVRLTPGAHDVGAQPMPAPARPAVACRLELAVARAPPINASGRHDDVRSRLAAPRLGWRGAPPTLVVVWTVRPGPRPDAARLSPQTDDITGCRAAVRDSTDAEARGSGGGDERDATVAGELRRPPPDTGRRGRRRLAGCQRQCPAAARLPAVIRRRGSRQSAGDERLDAHGDGAEHHVVAPTGPAAAPGRQPRGARLVNAGQRRRQLHGEGQADGVGHAEFAVRLGVRRLAGHLASGTVGHDGIGVRRGEEVTGPGGEGNERRGQAAAAGERRRAALGGDVQGDAHV
ncbi:hypothetical protein XA68_10685 [Ophiocordyceps unilateralis]|uniref:C2H2-type domain-containing protein n=1 Tax=Ophiocordyceps unilateralis TaxID=268505 RepID=A0A2A9PH99_OPHUN|nr:hypothetical protein XA68_10685 [Ophiocordyceps unilateralis]